jgi:glycosyltransferase involved in cell wall biosynthesis
VDGGSSDRTKEIIRTIKETSDIPIKLIETDGALPGRGRNLAIQGAAHEWIASIDGGIRPRVDWLEQLVETARNNPQAQVIYGTARPVTDTYFTECAAIAYLPPGPLRQFIASSLILRAAWTAAGGFREDLRSGEDLLFFRALEKASVKTAESPRAVVTWELRPNLATTFRRFVVYSRNGMKAGLARHWQYNVSRLYLLLLLLLLLGLWFWPLLLAPPLILMLRAEKRIWGWFRVTNRERVWSEVLNPRRVITVAWINVVIDVATSLGMLQWFFSERSAAR